MNQFFAEIMPQAGNGLDSLQITGANAVVCVLFLLILLFGVVLDFGTVVYCLKRKQRPAEWAEDLVAKALPGRMVAVLTGVFILLYLSVSVGYSLLFEATEIESSVLFYQTVAFHLPALILLAILLKKNGLSIGGTLGLTSNKTLQMLGLAILFYLAAMPIIWFYSILYQLLLSSVGYQPYLQDVSQIFMAPMGGWERAGVIFIATVAAPFFEEIAFRGVLFPWMVRRVGFWQGATIVSVLFGAMHMHIPSFLPLCLLSFMFCIAYARTRSIWVPFGMHVCFNGVSVAMLTLLGDSSIF